MYLGQANLNRNSTSNISAHKVLVEEKEDTLNDIKAILEFDMLGIRQKENKINELS